MDSPALGQVEQTTAFTLPADAEPPAPVPPAASAEQRPEWVDAVRDSLDEPGRYLAYEDAGRRIVVPVSGHLTRIGRSLSAQLRFDDATVSRRHAVIAADADGVRVLDDRSLNGIHVNGVRVDSGVLRDGDVIGVGRHCLWFLDNASVGGAVTAAAGAAADA